MVLSTQPIQPPISMITKILFTILVIFGVIIFARAKREKEMSAASSNTKPAEPSEGEKMFRQGAFLFLIFMALSALAMFYFELGERYATVSVHVVNTQTGERVTYQAEQKDIKSNSFKTLEGRTVYVADIERIEIETD